MSPGMWAVVVPAIVSVLAAAAAWLHADAAHRQLEAHTLRWRHQSTSTARHTHSDKTSAEE